MSLIIHYARKFGHALRGVLYALRSDKGFRFQMFLVGPIVLLVGYLFWPLTQVEILFLALGWIMVLVTEIQNTSIESALDHLHPDTHEKIGRSKDLAAGSVLLSGIFLLCVIIVIALF